MTELKLRQRWKGLSSLQRWSAILGCCLLFYTVFGFLILPAIIRIQLEKKLSQTLHRQTTVQEVKINPYTLEAAVNGFNIRDREGKGTFASFDSLQVNLQAISLFKRAIVIKSVSLLNPYSKIVFNKDKSFNFSDLTASNGSTEKAEKKEETKAAPLLFSINNIDLSGGRLDFTDKVKGVKHHISDLHIALPFLSDLPYQVEIFTKPAFAAVINGTPISMRGESKPFYRTRQSKVNINFRDIDLTDYLAYLPENLNFIIKKGRLDLDLSLSFKDENGKPAVNLLGKASLREVEVADRLEQPLLSFPDLTVDIDQAHLLRKKFHLASILWHKPELFVRRAQDGRLNLADLVTTSSKIENKSTPPSSSSSAPLLLEVADAVMEGGTIHFTDRTVAGPMQAILQPVNLQVKDFSTAPDKQCTVDLDLLLNKSGKVKAHGSAGILPLALQLDLDLADLPLDSVQPYVQQRLNVIMAGGRGTVKGKIALKQGTDGAVAATFQGNVSSRKFACLDARQAAKLLSWKGLQVKNLDVRTSPLRIKTDEILLDGLSAFVRKNRQGALNLGTIVRKEDGRKKPKKPAQPKGTPPEVKIKLVRLANCRVDFTDRSVTPQFNTTLQKIDGRIKGLSSGKDVSAAINITAKLDQHSPLQLTGSIQPWHNFFTDVTAKFSDIELSPVSPYSIKFIGYPLTMGKLNLNLHYRIKGRTLTSENKAFIDQITLGDFVKNKTAVKMPVQLAISLLKNRRGEIDLDIPVSGQLDDPKFSVGGVVFKIITNLIVKAATSPFSLLGAIFEGGGKEEYVRFAAGRAQISPEEIGVLTKFAKALYDHPAVKVELTGQADPAEDGKALTKSHFERLLKVQKLKDLAGKEAASDVDAIEIGAEEYNRYLKKAYQAADFKRPRNFLGMLKDIPPKEMQKLLYDHIVITDNELRDLAVARAKAVQDVLIEKGPVEPARIFLIEPQGASSAAKGQKGRRVEIAIK